MERKVRRSSREWMKRELIVKIRVPKVKGKKVEMERENQEML